MNGISSNFFANVNSLLKNIGNCPCFVTLRMAPPPVAGEATAAADGPVEDAAKEFPRATLANINALFCNSPFGCCSFGVAMLLVLHVERLRRGIQ